MKLGKYLKDKLYSICLFLCGLIIILLFLSAYKSPKEIIIAVAVISLFFYALTLIIDFFRKELFYNELIENLRRLDKKYLILETVSAPSFYDGELLYNIIYDVNKSMLENVKNYKLSIDDFKEYIEMWIHEVKIPIASLTLMAHNHRDLIDKRMVEQIKKVDSYIEQVLFYVRSENAEKDYLIKENRLSKIVGKAALKNKDDLLENKIDFATKNLNVNVLTDSKWLEFILNQIINNSIKYKDEDKRESYIKISADERKEVVVLKISDNGIGIKESDLPLVFEKSFTGENGRKHSKATGMGLYIANKLCEKLGHKIEIKSEVGKYTTVSIMFYKNEFFNVVK